MKQDSLFQNTVYSSPSGTCYCDDLLKNKLTKSVISYSLCFEALASEDWRKREWFLFSFSSSHSGCRQGEAQCFSLLASERHLAHETSYQNSVLSQGPTGWTRFTWKDDHSLKQCVCLHAWVAFVLTLNYVYFWFSPMCKAANQLCYKPHLFAALSEIHQIHKSHTKSVYLLF